MQPAAYPADRPADSWRVSREGAPVANVGLRHERGKVVVAADVEGVATSQPHRFGTVEDADAFIGDLITSFVYLGCDVASD